jgi:CBS domain-containing protein
MLAKDVMTTAVVTVLPGTEVREIAALFLERRISAVPVVDAQGQLRGIVSEGDLLNRPEAGTQHRRSWWLRLFSGPDDQAREYLRVHGRRAEDVMSEKVVTVPEDMPLAKIASLLERHRIKRVPVMRDGKLVGLVSRANLLQGLAAWRPEAPVKREDRDIRESLLAAFAEAGLPMHQVNVIVSEGVVQLWGGVETKSQHQAALAAAGDTPGVKRVDDHLGIISPMVRVAHGGV